MALILHNDWPARGAITCVDKASLVDGETVVLNDGANPPVTVELDVSGDGVASGNVAVDVSATNTADEVRDALVLAINAANGLDIEAQAAPDGTAGKLELENARGGTVGNQAITSTVANAGFVISGMSGGGQIPSGARCWVCGESAESQVPSGILAPGDLAYRVEETLQPELSGYMPEAHQSLHNLAAPTD